MALPSTLGTFPLLLPKLPIFPKANHSHTLEPSLQKLFYACNLKFIYPIVSHNEFSLSVFWTVIPNNTYCSVPSAPPILTSSTHPSFLSTSSELTVVYHFHQPLAHVLNFLYSIIHPVIHPGKSPTFINLTVHLLETFLSKVWKRKKQKYHRHQIFVIVGSLMTSTVHHNQCICVLVIIALVFHCSYFSSNP